MSRIPVDHQSSLIFGSMNDFNWIYQHDNPLAATDPLFQQFLNPVQTESFQFNPVKLFQQFNPVKLFQQISLLGTIKCTIKNQ